MHEIPKVSYEISLGAISRKTLEHLITRERH